MSLEIGLKHLATRFSSDVYFWAIFKTSPQRRQQRTSDKQSPDLARVLRSPPEATRRSDTAPKSLSDNPILGRLAGLSEPIAIARSANSFSRTIAVH